jgi:hypothetical protein
MNKQRVDEWLQRYVDAWKTYDRKKIGDLFSEAAEYRYHPYDEPIKGRAAVVNSWVKEPDRPGSFDARYRAIAVDGDVAVAAGNSTYFDQHGTIDRVYDNLFVLRFDDEGRCKEFTEWYFKRPSASSAGA